MLKMKINVEEENRDRIDKYLVNYLDESRSMIDKMIDAGYVLVNGNVVNAHYMVKVGDSIEVKDGFKIDTDIVAEDIPLDIVYEDDDLAIINKKSGMVVAKNNEAHRKLVDMLSKHEIKREYIALVKGEFMSDTATIDAPIGRDPQNRKKMAVVARNSKQAITHLRVIKRYKGYTLLRLALETGRTHQIRVHLNYIGFPIYNDPLYTGDSTTEFGQFLHSTSIEFDHPITGKHLHFEVGVPEE